MPKPNQKKTKIICILSNGTNISSTIKILETADYFKNMFDGEALGNNKCIELPNINSIFFPAIHAEMNNITTNKPLMTNLIYDSWPVSDLSTMLDATFYLGIRPLEKILIKKIAQKCDSFVGNSTQYFECLSQINTSLKEQYLVPKILKKISRLYYTATPETHSNIQSSSDKTIILHPTKTNGFEFKNSNNETINKINNNSGFEVHNSNKTTICKVKCHGTFPYNTFCFSHNNRFLLSCNSFKKLATVRSGSKKGWYCDLINIKENNYFKIKNIRWSHDDQDDVTFVNAAIIPEFSPDGKQLLIRTYNKYNAQTENFEGDEYKVIETSSNKTLKTIANQKWMENLFFLPSNKLCIKGRDNETKKKIVFFTNSYNDNENITFSDLEQYIFNETKTIFIALNIFPKTITIYDINKHTTQQIPFDFNNIKLKYDNKNDIFCIYGHDASKFKILLYDKKQYDQTQQTPKEITLNKSSLERFSINISNNKILAYETKMNDQNFNAFLYDLITEKWDEILLFNSKPSNLKSSSYQLDSSGQYIIYQHNHGKNEETIGYLDIKNKENIPLMENVKYTHIMIHPSQPIVFIHTENSTLIIHDCNKKETIGSYEKATWMSNSFSSCFNKNKTLFLVFQDHQTLIINPSTNKIILSLPHACLSSECDDTISWEGNVLVHRQKILQQGKFKETKYNFTASIKPENENVLF
jgi:hypothetical protein